MITLLAVQCWCEGQRKLHANIKNIFIHVIHYLKEQFRRDVENMYL